MGKEKKHENPEEVEVEKQEETSTEETAMGASGEDTEALKKEIADLKDQKLRVMAEYDNYKKRTQKEKQDIYRVAEFDTILQILPIFDNLERGLESSTSDDNVRKGIEMIYNQGVEVLKKIGITEIDSVNQPFNPELHNAVMHTENSDVDASTVVEVLQKGYEKDGKVIRHAMVKVAN